MSATLGVLLQLCDSLFPIGAFSHSDGLETATSAGEVASVEHLRAWMDATLRDTLRRLEGPAVSRAWLAWSDRDIPALLELDDEMHAIRPSSTARTASRAMGSRLLKTWASIHPRHELPALPPSHPRLTLPVSFGVVTSAAAVARPDALHGFLYSRLASTVSAAMRLMPLGQDDGHRLLAEMIDVVPRVVAEIAAAGEPVMSFAPLLDRAAMNHQYVHSRLFRS